MNRRKFVKGLGSRGVDAKPKERVFMGMDFAKPGSEQTVIFNPSVIAPELGPATVLGGVQEP